MYKGQLTRDQAVAAVGEEAVKAVEAENCDYTNRLMPGGFEDVVEFAASSQCTDTDGTACTLVAYYYQDATDVAAAQELDHLDWEIRGYEIY